MPHDARITGDGQRQSFYVHHDNSERLPTSPRPAPGTPCGDEPKRRFLAICDADLDYIQHSYYILRIVLSTRNRLAWPGLNRACNDTCPLAFAQSSANTYTTRVITHN